MAHIRTALLRSKEEALERTVERVLACPRCRGSLAAFSGGIRCRSARCDFRGVISEGVVLMEDRPDVSYFDDKHQLVRHGSEKPGVCRLCYADQARFLESNLAPSTTVLDVGCGSTLPYKRTVPYFLIGLDPSYESLRHNVEVDLRIYGYGYRLPLADRSVDVVLSLYAIHHFGGKNLKENRYRIARAFAEFGRVLKPNGDLFIFELEPWWPVWKVQCALWNTVRKMIPSLDMLFWRASSLYKLSADHLNRKATFHNIRFRTPLFTIFAPVFTLPRLKIPRFLFPFRVCLYHWRLC